MVNFVALSIRVRNHIRIIENRWTCLTAYSPTSRPTATSNSCVGVLSETSSKSRLGSFANLSRESASVACQCMRRYHQLDMGNLGTPRSTHQDNFLRSLIAGTGFQKERPQFDRAGKRNANDPAWKNHSGGQDRS